MSTAKRTYDILRGYVNREWDRIQGIELTDAERELSDALDNPAPRPRPATGAAVETIDADTSASEVAIARRILGVDEGASFAEVRTAFDRVVKRTDPVNFPAGSPEAQQAAEIHRRVHRAYDILTEGMDATEKRFRTLEIE